MMERSNHSRAFPHIGAALLLLGAGCSSAGAAPLYLSNPGFESQLCAQAILCDWAVEGDVASVPTWHESDRGVALVSTTASLSQLIDPLDESPCVAFKLVADVSAASNVVIELDFDDDGRIDYQDEVPESHWALLTYQHAIPTGAQRLRVTIAKHADGHAVLARLDLHSTACAP